MRRLLSLLSGLQEGRRDEAVVSVLLERASGGIHLDSLVPATHTHTLQPRSQFRWNAITGLQWRHVASETNCSLHLVTVTQSRSVRGG